MCQIARTPETMRCTVRGAAEIETGQRSQIDRHGGRMGFAAGRRTQLESVRQQRRQPEQPRAIGGLIRVRREIATPSARKTRSEHLGFLIWSPSSGENHDDNLRRVEDIPRQNRQQKYDLHVHRLPVRASQNSAWRHLISTLISSAREVKTEQLWIDFADTVSRYHDLENTSKMVNVLLP